MTRRPQRVLILGLGQYPKGSGIAAAIFFARQKADVLVSDFYYTPAMKENVRRLKRFTNVRFVFNRHPIAEIRNFDLIVKHQRARRTEPELIEARKRGIPIETAESLFLKQCPCQVVGITGTRGKSTTTTLVAEMLKMSGKRVWLGGNILISPLTFLKKIKPDDAVVLELSSFQLEGTGEAGISPHVACITNLMRDHLNTYSGMEEYAEAKAQIFRHQNADGVVVLNAEDAFARRWKLEAPGRVHLFSKRQSLPGPFRLPGEHNRMNALAAVLTALAAGATKAGIRKALGAFRGIPDRQEVIAVKHGITYVNDTTATTPDGTIAALRTFKDPKRTIRLILGGSDKELEFDELARELKRHRVDVMLLPGTAQAKLSNALRSKRVPFKDCSDLRTAIYELRSRSQRGDAIILSPACASFGLFKNEFDRGNAFRKIVASLDRMAA